jgi:hypothetical protein
LITLLFSACAPARADPSVELSGSAGFGVLAAGITPGRFAISPSVSLSVRGKRGFFVARDTVSFLGATGGRFGINNETTLGGGLFWERVNVSAGLSLAAYSLTGRNIGPPSRHMTANVTPVKAPDLHRGKSRIRSTWPTDRSTLRA